jgi:hypothetical protein
MSTKKYYRDTFWHYINPVSLSMGIIGILLHFGLKPLWVGIIGFWLWGMTGIIAAKMDKKA